MAKRKRRPGAGRKPKGPIKEKKENFSTRITAETRDALERESVETGYSISQIAEWLLRTSLEAKHRRRTMRPIQALSFLVERVALAASNATYIKAPGRLDERIARWRVDPFAFRAFKVAVLMLFDFLEPQGPTISPLRANNPRGIAARPHLTDQEWQRIGQFFETPEVHGAYIFSRLLSELLAEQPTDLRKVMMSSPEQSEIASNEFYGIQHARRDLGLTASRETDQ